MLTKYFEYKGLKMTVDYKMDPDIIIEHINPYVVQDVNWDLTLDDEFRYAFTEHVTTNQREIL